MSSTSTPTPSTTQMSLDRANFLEAPKPFKNAAYGARTTNRRNKTLKQILVAERDYAMGLDIGNGASSSGANGAASGAGGGGSSKKRGRKSAAAANDEVVLGPGGRRLVGAAAKAAKKREEKERLQALKDENGGGDGNSSEADVTAMTGVEGDASSVADVSMTAAKDEETALEDKKAEEEEEEEKKKKLLELQELQRRRRNVPTYSSVEAPPSLRPRKKYCDISGLLAPYTDPKTHLRYHSVEMYEIVKTFAPGVDQSYLNLRGESSQIK